MTYQQMKRREWLYAHPLADYMAKCNATAHCYRCGKVRTLNELAEVGNCVYLCKGGCRV